MRSRFFSKVLLAILLATAVATPFFPTGVKKAEARDWGTCGSCYQFFAFSTPGLYTGCIIAELKCGGSGECMCRVHAKLAQIYTRDYLFQKELSFWLRFGYGVFVPGVRLIDPDNRAKLADPDVPFYVKSDLVFDKSLVILNVLGLGFGAAAELNNLIGLMNAMSHAMDANEKPSDRIVNIMIGATPYMGGAFELYGNALDLANQTKDLLPNPDDTEQKAAVPAVEKAPSSPAEATTPPAENAPSPSVESEPISDPISDNQLIKVAGAAIDDQLNEAEKYADLLKREPALPSKVEDFKKILGDYETGKPISVWKVRGAPEVQMPGSEDWAVLKEGDIIPPGARIFTGMEDDLFINLPGVYIVKVRSLTDVTFNKIEVVDALLKGKFITQLDLRDGDVEVEVEQGTYQATMQVEMPQYVAGVRGTHFWASYDKTKRLGSVGVYEGEVAVDDLSRGTRTLLTPAQVGPRVMVMPAFKLQNRETLVPVAPQKKRGGVFVWAIIFILGGLGYVAYRKRQMIMALFHRQNKNGF